MVVAVFYSGMERTIAVAIGIVIASVIVIAIVTIFIVTILAVLVHTIAIGSSIRSGNESVRLERRIARRLDAEGQPSVLSN